MGNSVLNKSSFVQKRTDHVISDIDLNQNISNNTTSILLLYRHIDTQKEPNFIKLLVSQNVNQLEQIQPSGNTALHLAFEILNADAIRTILPHAQTYLININVRNRDNYTPIALFKITRNNILKLINNNENLPIQLSQKQAIENIKLIEKEIVVQFKQLMKSQKSYKFDDVFINFKYKGTALNPNNEIKSSKISHEDINASNKPNNSNHINSSVLNSSFNNMYPELSKLSLIDLNTINLNTNEQSNLIDKLLNNTCWCLKMIQNNNWIIHSENNSLKIYLNDISSKFIHFKSEIFIPNITSSMLISQLKNTNGWMKDTYAKTLDQQYTKTLTEIEDSKLCIKCNQVVSKAPPFYTDRFFESVNLFYIGINGGFMSAMSDENQQAVQDSKYHRVKLDGSLLLCQNVADNKGCRVTLFSQTNPDVGFTGFLIKNSTIEKANLSKFREQIIDRQNNKELIKQIDK